MTIVVLGVLWALWPVIALAGGLGFSVATGIAALVLLPSTATSLRPRLYACVLLAFFVYAGLSTLWSPREQDLVAIDLGRMQFAIRSEMLRVGLQILALGGLIAAAMRLDAADKLRLQQIGHVALVVQMGLLVILSLFENQILDMLRGFVPDTGEGVQNITRNCLIMAVAAPVMSIGVAQGRRPAISVPVTMIVALAAATILAVRGVNAGLLAMTAAAACTAVAYFLPRVGFRIIALALAGLLMTAPLVFGFLSQGATFATADDSSTYRAAIWQRVIELINQQPVTGNGLGVLRTVRETIETGVFAGQFTVPNHAHNMMLQVWAETGAVGAALLSLAIVLAGWRLPDARKLGPAGLKAAALAGAMAAVAAVSFDLWNDWWWAVGGLLAVLTVATPAVVTRAQAVASGEGLVFGGSVSALQTGSAHAEPAQPDASSLPTPAEHAQNNFNLLRLVFALMVVAYHAIALPGLLGWQQAEAWTSVGAELGVQGFFVLSGYLVWASLERSGSLALYAEKRARRLLPAYIAVVVACAVLAVILVPEARGELSAVARYLGWNLAFLNFMAPDMPGVFAANRFPEINGALWTLKIEVMFYLVLPLLAWGLRLAGARRWIAIAGIYVLAEAWRVMFEQSGMIELSRQLPGQMSFFITGVALCAWRNELNWKSMIAPFGFLLLFVSLILPQADALRPAGLGIVAVWLAVGIPKLFDAARFGDLSYGLYIVHFPILQTVIAIGLFGTSPALALIVAAIASVGAALLLWWFVERPALRRDSAYRLAAA